MGVVLALVIVAVGGAYLWWMRCRCITQSYDKGFEDGRFVAEVFDTLTKAERAALAAEALRNVSPR